LLFQGLDDKSECVGIYCDGKLIFDDESFPDNLSKTWKYSSYLRGRESIEYANLYIQDKTIEQVVPEYLLDDWNDVSDRLSAFTRSLKIANVNCDEHCIYDLTPKRFLVELCEVKNRITDYVIKNYKRPERYDFLLKVCQMLEDISNSPLKLDHQRLNVYMSGNKTKQFAESIARSSGCIKYNQFGTKTGRLTTRPSSFPVLTLRKEMRDVVVPHNDYFLELDFNGAEARVMMGLLNKPQPEQDIHLFHQTEVFGGTQDRDRVKTAFFAWLYGSAASARSDEGKILRGFYNKEAILDKYWDGKSVYTCYRKEIKDVDEHHALNYIIQSTTAELTLLQALKINHLLGALGAKSKISCIIHDAIVLDFSIEDEHLLGDIKKLMSSTKFGEFKINICKGHNLAMLKEVSI
tara:strand:+ start:4522 stop:5742 length:1221 start_codon:yes stop_codon:yes gene_type:complete